MHQLVGKDSFSRVPHATEDKSFAPHAKEREEEAIKGMDSHHKRGWLLEVGERRAEIGQKAVDKKKEVIQRSGGFFLICFRVV